MQAQNTNIRYGCNEVLPRRFDEVQAIYSTSMLGVFSGGLVYEFTQEPNNYGLVELDINGNVKLLPDFFALKRQFETLPPIDTEFIHKAMRLNAKETKLKAKGRSRFTQLQCQDSYQSLDISRGLPPPVFEVSKKAGRTHLWLVVICCLSQTSFGTTMICLLPFGETYRQVH